MSFAQPAVGGMCGVAGLYLLLHPDSRCLRIRFECFWFLFCCHCSYRVNKEELYCFSVSDNLVAAGGQGDVHFWDRRTQQPLASFDDMHMDDVTQVCTADQHAERIACPGAKCTAAAAAQFHHPPQE